MPFALPEYEAAVKIRGVARRPGVEPFTRRLRHAPAPSGGQTLGAEMDFPVVWVWNVQLVLVADPAGVWNGPRR